MVVKRKVMVIDKTAVLEKYHQKCVALAKYADIDLTLFVPKAWIENYQKVTLQKRKDPKYEIVTGRVFFKGYENRGFYFGLSLPATVRKVKPDVILMFEEPFSLFSLQTIISKKLFAPNAKLVFYSFDNQSWNHNYSYRPSWLYKLIDLFALRNSDYAIVSNLEAKEILISKGFSSDSISIIPWGIDPKQFRDLDAKDKIKAELGLSGFVVGYVGRLLKMKGIHVLIEATSQLEKEHSDIMLLLVGEGPDRNNFEHMTKAKGIGRNVIFTGYVESEDLVKYYNAMDVLVLPSLTTATWKEQLGRVLIEAMACGTPVIGSSSGAIPEVIDDSGLVFQERNIDALKRAIFSIKQDDALRPKLVEKGKRLVQEKYTWDAFGKKVHGIITFIVERH